MTDYSDKKIMFIFQDILPDNHSAIIIDEFKSVKELASYLDRKSVV